MNLISKLRQGVATAVNVQLGARLERPLADWELREILTRIPTGGFPLIEGDAPVEADLESEDGRVELGFLVERVLEGLELVRVGERRAGIGGAVGRPGQHPRQSEQPAAWPRWYRPGSWDQELEKRSERLRPLQEDALLLIFGEESKATPCPPETVPPLLKAIAREELPAGGRAWMWAPYEVSGTSVLVKNVFLRGLRGPAPPAPQLSFLDDPKRRMASPRGRLQGLRELIRKVVERSGCSEGEAVAYLLCGTTISYGPVFGAVDTGHDDLWMTIELRSVDLPLCAVASTYRGLRKVHAGVDRSPSGRKRSPWPTVIFDFVQARSRLQRRRNWPPIWDEFKRDPRHAGCPCVANKKLTDKGRLESFRQTYFTEEKRRGSRASVLPTDEAGDFEY
jgi:hypothetical protein